MYNWMQIEGVLIGDKCRFQLETSTQTKLITITG